MLHLDSFFHILKLFSAMLHPDSFPHVNALVIDLHTKETRKRLKLNASHINDVKAHFARYGEVKAVNIHLDMEGAFVLFDRSDALNAAVTTTSRPEMRVGADNYSFRIVKLS